MADPRRGWLELQADLGGSEVYFKHPLGKSESREINSSPTGSEPVGAAVPEAKRKGQRKVAKYAPGDEPSWLIDAPPIPEDGLFVSVDSGGFGTESRAGSLEEIASTVSECTACPLCRGRTRTVPGEGNPNADLMVIGEGPGAQEDETGRPFVGRAGNILDKMLAAIGLPRESVFIANVVKCRPPKNRAPLPDERAACMPYLYRQISLVKPRVILALGGTAAEALLGVKGPLGSVRMKVHHLNGVPLVVTYHPAALLRNSNWKRPAWDDVRIARQLLDLDE